MTLATALFVVSQLPVWMVDEAYTASEMEPQARPACYQVNVSRETHAHVCITKQQWCRIHSAMGEFRHETCAAEQWTAAVGE